MTNKEERKLLSEFPAVSTEQWEALIEADLKGADYQKKLVWRTDEGFEVRPYYRAEDLKGVKHLAAGVGEFPYVRSTGKDGGWRTYQRVEVGDCKVANHEILNYIKGGADGIDLHITERKFSATDLETLTKGVDFQAIEVTFSGVGVSKIAELMIAKADKEGFDPKATRVNFTIDPILFKLSLKGSLGEGDGERCFSTIKSLIERGAKYKRFRFVGVAGLHFHNSGSTIVQELAFTLAAGHDYVVRLMEAGLSVDDVAPRMRFSMAISSNYFMEIAKFRAGRMLWATIMAPYKPTRGCSSKMMTHAVTSKWNITNYDAYVNMLRGTTEAMSAVIGGVHSMTVLPFNAGYDAPSDFSSRIARNVQLLLKHESHFDNVVDVAGGSYYIETLTQSIAEQAWALFKEVEKRGGYIEAFKSGFIQEEIAKSAAQKDINIATRRQILLGTNQYPDFNEVAPAETQKSVCEAEYGCGCAVDGEPGVATLKPYRGAEAFEEIRLAVDSSGRSPKAFMLTAGTLAMARARALFASNFFGCAGIRIIDNNFFESVEKGVDKALKSGAEIVVLCAADDDYAELAPRVKKLLGERAILVVAGTPASTDELKAQGISNFISVRSNVLESLKFYLQELGIVATKR